MTTSTKLAMLGDLAPDEFLSQYWQREPLLIRNAFPDFTPPVSGDELAGLSLEEEVESRLIQQPEGAREWHLQSGPFTESTFSKLPEQNWTLLVQAVDLWVPEATHLLQQFDFVPTWRLDDLMVSFAAPGGSAGPHYDHYDVFLLQAEGQRRWHVGQRCDATTPLTDNPDLRILADFQQQASWLLEAGGMLYIPPGLAHWGIAETAGMTYSIGFRAPRMADLLDEIVLQLMEDTTFYTDPPNLTDAREELTPEIIQHARVLLQQALENDALVGDALARLVTQPKYPDLVDVTGEERRVRIGTQTYLNGLPVNSETS